MNVSMFISIKEMYSDIRTREVTNHASESLLIRILRLVNRQRLLAENNNVMDGGYWYSCPASGRF